MEEGQVLNQDLSKKAPEAGAVCPIHLFFKQKVEMPSKEKIIEGKKEYSNLDMF